MKIDIVSDGCVYIELNGWTYYIDDSTNEQLIDKWINTESIKYNFNKKFIKGSFFKSLPPRVQNSFKRASFYKTHYDIDFDIDFCNVSEYEGIQFINTKIDDLWRFPKIGRKSMLQIQDCLKKWKESHQIERKTK